MLTRGDRRELVADLRKEIARNLRIARLSAQAACPESAAAYAAIAHGLLQAIEIIKALPVAEKGKR